MFMLVFQGLNFTFAYFKTNTKMIILSISFHIPYHCSFEEGTDKHLTDIYDFQKYVRILKKISACMKVALIKCITTLNGVYDVLRFFTMFYEFCIEVFKLMVIRFYDDHRLTVFMMFYDVPWCVTIFSILYRRFLSGGN